MIPSSLCIQKNLNYSLCCPVHFRGGGSSFNVCKWASFCSLSHHHIMNQHFSLEIVAFNCIGGFINVMQCNQPLDNPGAFFQNFPSIFGLVRQYNNVYLEVIKTSVNIPKTIYCIVQSRGLSREHFLVTKPDEQERDDF